MPGLSAWERVSVPQTLTTANNTVTAICPGTKKVLGGGVAHTSATWEVVQSWPSADGSWSVTLARQSGSATTIATAYALCANTN